jgi:hypothetical protein
LREIADARPKSHDEVFRLLEERKVAIPRSKLFEMPGGWVRGFQGDPRAASAYLSKAWGRLRLPAFLRGPKK